MFFGLDSPYPPSPKPPTTHRCILYLLTQSLLFKGPKYKINYAFPYFFFGMQKKYTQQYYSFIFEIIVRASAFAMCCLASSSSSSSLLPPNARAHSQKLQMNGPAFFPQNSVSSEAYTSLKQMNGLTNIHTYTASIYTTTILLKLTSPQLLYYFAGLLFEK